MTQTMMSLIKRRRGRGSDSRIGKTGRRSERKTKSVKLPKTLGVTAPGASTNQMTCATILNIAKIRVKNDTTVMVSNLPNRHKMHGQIGNKRNTRDMKRVRTKHILSSNRKRGTIGGMNNVIAIRRMQSKKMSRMRSRMKRSVKI
jgi:hypothetical protein